MLLALIRQLHRLLVILQGKMSSHTSRFFRQKDTELRLWFNSLISKDGTNAIAVIRDALTCLRLIQLHAAGQSWQEWVERANAALILVESFERGLVEDEG